YKRHLSTTSNSQTPNSTMAKTKELSKDTRNKIVDLHQAGKTESAIDGDVILESPVHPVSEGHPLTLRCLYHNPNPSNLRADFYKDGSVLQNQTTGEMIIQTVSKSDEGFYHCKHPERGGGSSWIHVQGWRGGRRRES
ncbi:hypothetical protein QTP86_015551, partial [Hemibagrus guttatus]